MVRVAIIGHTCHGCGKWIFHSLAGLMLTCGWINVKLILPCTKFLTPFRWRLHIWVCLDKQPTSFSHTKRWWMWWHGIISRQQSSMNLRFLHIEIRCLNCLHWNKHHLSWNIAISLSIWFRTNYVYAIKNYFHPLCAMEWHIGNCFECMTCGMSGTQGMKIISDGIQGIAPFHFGWPFFSLFSSRQLLLAWVGRLFFIITLSS